MPQQSVIDDFAVSGVQENMKFNTIIEQKDNVSSVSTVEVTTYEKVTNMNKIPFEQESVVFMAQSINSQQRKLVQEALNQGLKLKALDEDIKTEAQKRRA